MGRKTNYKNLVEFLNDIKTISVGQKLYIWGIGIYGSLLGKLFNENEIMWSGYYNNYDNVNVEMLNSKPVYKGEEVVNSENAIYILAMRRYNAVKSQLNSMGIGDEYIIFFDNVDILNSIGDSAESFDSSDKIQTFHNVHRGEKCFIIGNGPSLCINDLNTIGNSGMVSFGSNLIFKCYDKTMWRPNYYFVMDGNVVREITQNEEVMNYVAHNCHYMFTRSNGELGKCVHNVQNMILLHSVYSSSEESFDFSSDCSEKIFIGYTVTYAMLQMAVYMGFKEIYLLGMDHTFSIVINSEGNVVKDKSIKDHSDILGNYAMKGIADTIATTRVYMSARKYADEHDIKIYNATRGGKLEVFERVDFDELFD